MSKNNQPTIEEKIAILEKLVAWFDSDDFVLEEALAKYDEAQKLAAEIGQDIATLKNTIEQVNLSTQE